MSSTAVENGDHDQITKEVGFSISNYFVPSLLNKDCVQPLSPVYTPEEMQQINRAKEEYLEQYNFQYCVDANKYKIMLKIGQGSFGEVFKAKEKNNPKQIVAMKKIRMEHEKNGFPTTSLREIQILQQLKHENIVSLLEICQTKASQNNSNRSTFYLVFEFCEHDLAGLISNITLKFNLGEIKSILQQMLNALHYIHGNKILHRDLKSANVLITKNGILKLADFGLARAFSVQKNDQPNSYTNLVVSLWYRCPELLLGECNYGPSIDLWSVGCIMAELWTRCPIMQGNSEVHQLILISKLCGSITPEVWPNVENLDLYNSCELLDGQKRKVTDLIKPYIQDPLAYDLLDKLLILDPERRIDADSALNHDFFWTNPMPCDLSKVVSQLEISNYEYVVQYRINNYKP